MENLQKVIDPDIGVITNIGDAHRENFPDDRRRQQKNLNFSRIQKQLFTAETRR